MNEAATFQRFSCLKHFAIHLKPLEETLIYFLLGLGDDVVPFSKPTSRGPEGEFELLLRLEVLFEAEVPGAGGLDGADECQAIGVEIC